MKTTWDYTSLADAYLERPDYAPAALDELCAIAELRKGDRVCDIGAGVAHLTLPLARRGLRVDAVEPNDAMRANGQRRTADLPGVCWYEGTGEHTGRPTASYDFVSFGSSFNVCDRTAALHETARLLKPGKWFCCLWNHRDLTDPTQQAIEAVIRRFIPDYDYGSRREDQRDVIVASGLFTDVRTATGQVRHNQPVDKVIEAWRSHATLHRQAGPRFEAVVAAIADLLRALPSATLDIPYTTHVWLARRDR